MQPIRTSQHDTHLEDLLSFLFAAIIWAMRLTDRRGMVTIWGEYMPVQLEGVAMTINASDTVHQAERN
jgi:hypothetical protein